MVFQVICEGQGDFPINLLVKIMSTLSLYLDMPEEGIWSHYSQMVVSHHVGIELWKNSVLNFWDISSLNIRSF